MADILSQEEINALLSAIAEGDVAPEPKAPTSPQRVRKWDFRRPDKFSKDQLRTLQMIHDNFARLLQTSLSGYLRTVVDADVTGVEQATYEEFIRTLSNPTILSVFSFPPLEGNAILEINPDIGFIIIDRLLGGPGTVLKRNRELTEIEQPVMRRILRRFLDSLREAWANVEALEPTLERLDMNPQFTQLIPPRDMVIVISITLSIRGIDGRVNICIPYVALEPVIPKLTAHYLFSSGQKTRDPADAGMLQKRLQGLQVPLAVMLGTSTLTVRELLDLSRGDVIKLSTRSAGDLPIMVGERLKFMGRPGQIGGKVAVEITGLAQEGD